MQFRVFFDRIITSFIDFFGDKTRLSPYFFDTIETSSILSNSKTSFSFAIAFSFCYLCKA